MFENYKATREDFEVIEEGIKIIWHPKLNFVFKNKKFIKKVIVVSYDCENIYLWSPIKFPKLTSIKCNLKQYFAYQFPHKLKISDDYQYWWRAGLQPEELIWLLSSKMKPDEYESTSFVSGGLITPFITLQKKMKDRKKNPYTTYESYLATIIHEFGHVYYNQHNPDRLAKQDRLNLLIAALELYFHKTTLRQKPPTLYLPNPLNFSEIFAFCTEYTASNIFFKKHLKEVNKFDMEWIKTLIKKEEKTSLSSDRITISLNEENTAHATATVFGKIILNFYPENWPQKLLQQHYL